MSTSLEFPVVRPHEEDEAQFGSLSQQAYQLIREKIVTLQLAPGEPINEGALMEELQLGRTPIREAMQRLACEGLVVMRPRRGAVVASLSILDLQQLFELRRVLEGLAASLAAERATESDIAAMEATLVALDQAGQSEDTRAYIEIDRAFHRAMARSAHNKFLEHTLGRLYNLNLRLWYLAMDQIGPMREAVEEHRRVLEAIVSHDCPQADAVIREHITDFQSRVKDIL